MAGRSDSWELLATPGDVRRARELASTFAATAGALGALVSDVRLAVSEAMSNAVVHAYGDDAREARVRLSCREEDAELVVSVSDAGTGLRGRPDSPGAGLGLALIARVAQSVEALESAGGGLNLVMRFALAPQAAGAPEDAARQDLTAALRARVVSATSSTPDPSAAPGKADFAVAHDDAGSSPALVTVLGTIDMLSAPRFTGALEQARAAQRDVVVDLAGCPFTDSSGLAAIIGLHLALREAERRLILVAPEGTSPGRLLDLTLAGVVERAPSVEAALLFLAAPA